MVAAPLRCHQFCAFGLQKAKGKAHTLMEVRVFV